MRSLVRAGVALVALATAPARSPRPRPPPPPPGVPTPPRPPTGRPGPRRPPSPPLTLDRSPSRTLARGTDTRATPRAAAGPPPTGFGDGTGSQGHPQSLGFARLT